MLHSQKSGIADLRHFGSLESVLPENDSAHLSGRPCLERDNFPSGSGVTHSPLAIQGA